MQSNFYFYFYFLSSILLFINSILSYISQSRSQKTLELKTKIFELRIEELLLQQKLAAIVVEPAPVYSIFTDPYLTTTAAVLLGATAVLVLYFLFSGSDIPPSFPPVGGGGGGVDLSITSLPETFVENTGNTILQNSVDSALVLSKFPPVGGGDVDLSITSLPETFVENTGNTILQNGVDSALVLSKNMDHLEWLSNFRITCVELFDDRTVDPILTSISQETLALSIESLEKAKMILDVAESKVILIAYNNISTVETLAAVTEILNNI